MVEVLPEELAGIGADAHRPQNVLHKVVFEREHRFRRVAGGGPFDAAELAAHPERYSGGLDRWLEHLTVPKCSDDSAGSWQGR